MNPRTQPREQPRAKLDAQQVADMLGFRKAYVLDLARAGKIPHRRIGRYCRFDVDEVEAWWAAGCPADSGARRAA